MFCDIVVLLSQPLMEYVGDISTVNDMGLLNKQFNQMFRVPSARGFYIVPIVRNSVNYLVHVLDKGVGILEMLLEVASGPQAPRVAVSGGFALHCLSPSTPYGDIDVFLEYENFGIEIDSPAHILDLLNSFKPEGVEFTKENNALFKAFESIHDEVDDSFEYISREIYSAVIRGFKVQMIFVHYEAGLTGIGALHLGALVKGLAAAKNADAQPRYMRTFDIANVCIEYVVEASSYITVNAYEKCILPVVTRRLEFTESFYTRLEEMRALKGVASASRQQRLQKYADKGFKITERAKAFAAKCFPAMDMSHL